MALLDRPLYGEEATGTLARVLAYRRTKNWGTVAKLPGSSCPPSPEQTSQRNNYTAAITAWHALGPTIQNQYKSNSPRNLSGYNFFLRLFLSPTLAYFGYCIFGMAYFQLAPSPDQPKESEYDRYFPIGMDEFPTLQNGKHSPQAWLMNRTYNTITDIQEYIITHKEKIET